VEAGVELQGGFNGHDAIHFKTGKLKKVFYAGIFKITSIHSIATIFVVLLQKYTLCRFFVKIMQTYVDFMQTYVDIMQTYAGNDNNFGDW
jgi:hypothetical protein